jgi:chromosome segregation ATPase
MVTRKHLSIATLAAISLLGNVFSLAAQEPSPGEEKLREALKAVTLQLRTAESDKAVAQAEKTAADLKNVELTAQVEKMSKQLTALSEEKATALDNAAREQARLGDLLKTKESELDAYRKTLDKWKAAHFEISDIAKKKEAERAKYAAQSAELERRVAGLKSQNIELFNIGNEILERYRKFSFGEALRAREPFTGINKVKLQNLVQDYHEKLLDQTAKP